MDAPTTLMIWVTMMCAVFSTVGIIAIHRTVQEILDEVKKGVKQ